jgi:hypothetical protein
MFTIEMEHDEIEIVVIDDCAENEDLSVILYDDIAFIRQWDEELGYYHSIMISPDMWDELVQAMNKPAGAYQTVKRVKEIDEFK